MKIWELSVKRPIFMSCVLVALMVVGIFSYTKLPVELFPEISLPVVVVTTVYPGAGPTEIESLVSKPIEDNLSTVSGIKNVRSVNRESMSVVIAEFNLDIDIKYAEQQVRDKVANIRRQLPDDIEEPTIARVDPAAQPIMILAIKSDLQGSQLFDLAKERVKPLLEQVNQVGQVEVIGGRQREIQIQLDRNKLARREMSVSQIAAGLNNSGQNVPAGKIDKASSSELVFRTLGEFNSIDQIQNTIVSFFGNEVVTKISDVGRVEDTLADAKMKSFLDGKETIFLNLYKQSGSNTIAVADGVFKKVDQINLDLKQLYGENFELVVARDTSRLVWNNVFDVLESIGIGIILTVLVVYFFLGSLRSTIITGFAIPVSLIGSMALLYIFGLTINVMSLLAFSLAVGLLIDDAIVVRENIFRHMEMGKSALKAALDGTAEVGLAVLAVTLAVLSVFGPIAFLSGVIGQFFKSFGLGVCFVMIISLFDALTNAPMLSAYFGGKHVDIKTQKPKWTNPIRALVIFFDRFQAFLENTYEKFLKFIVRWPSAALLGCIAVVVALAATVPYISKTFLPPSDSGEFIVAFELKPGATLEQMSQETLAAEKVIKEIPEVAQTIVIAGNASGQSYISTVYVNLKAFGDRKKNTSEVKNDVRELLMKKASHLSPKVKDIDLVGGGQRPFVVNIRGQDLEQVREVSTKLFAKLQKNPSLIDPESNDKPGLPEFQIKIDNAKAQYFGVSPAIVGGELRNQIEGAIPAKFRENGLEYDIRVRLQENQRDIEQSYATTRVPNLNGRMVALRDFTTPQKEVGFASINRENRMRFISIEADVAPGGSGMGGVINEINEIFKSKEIELPPGVTYKFVGQAESFQELIVSVLVAGLLGLIFIYLVLASLYESTVTPFTIMLVIPFAIVGGFFGLFVMDSTLDLFSMIGCVMLMGLATKNSIIMVDYINQKLVEGVKLNDAIIQGCKTRLRPILMTSFALVAGMLPVAIGLNEASSQRKSLGIAVVGGVLVSTFLTLILIPAVFSYIERGRKWMLKNVGSRLITQADHSEER